MTIYQLEALLTLASTLNYTKAAAILHTTQPNLTRMIFNLESEIGVLLLSRNKRDVKLTPAGSAFCAEAEKLIAQYHYAVSKAKEVELGVSGSIEVGFLGTALIWQLPKIINRFREKHPDILINLMDFTYPQLIGALEEDTVDVALMPDRELDRIPNLSKKFIFADDMCMVMGRDHPCAEAESVELALFKNEPFIMMDQKISKADYNMVSNICIEQDFIPRVVYETNTLNNLILMIECGNGVSILAKHMSHFATDNVSFVRLKGYDKYFRVSCVWRREVNPCIPFFLDVVDECVT